MFINPFIINQLLTDRAKGKEEEMRVHHLNCGCMCPFGGALYDGFSRSPMAHLSCHCLLLETDAHGLVLVDTGFGLQDMARPGHRLSGFFSAV